jgi:hypothetical protein
MHEYMQSSSNAVRNQHSYASIQMHDIFRSHVAIIRYILWHEDSLLSNDLGISNYTTAVAK